MKRSQIGNINIDITTGKIWWGSNNYEQLRQSEKELYVEIDTYQEYSNIAKNDSEISENYDKMDRLFCVCKLIESFGDNLSLLNEAGVVMNDYLLHGKFDKKFNSLAIRNAYVDELVAKLIEETNNFRGAAAYQVSADFQNWWNNRVINKNYYRDADGNKTNEKPTSVSICGEVTNICDAFKGIGPLLFRSEIDSTRYPMTKETLLKRIDDFTFRNVIKNTAHGIESDEQQSNLIRGGISSATYNTDGETKDPTIFAKNCAAGVYPLETAVNGPGLAIAILSLAGTLLSAIAAIFVAWKQAEAAEKISQYDKEKSKDTNDLKTKEVIASVEKTKISYKYFLYGAAILAAISLLD